MRLDTLDALSDDELRAVDARCLELLKQHDTERKDKAISEARVALAAVGLSLKDLIRKAPKRTCPVYHSGQMYRHPSDTSLVWSGKGKKPGWLTALEQEGGKAIEVDSKKGR